MEYKKDYLKDLLEGKLSSDEIREIQRNILDEDRFNKVLEIEKENVEWPEKILLCLQENLYIVEKDGKKIVKCKCGFEFTDYKINWKEKALVYERDCNDGKVFIGPRAADPDYMILREFYCPGCGAQLEVEAVPTGYPFVFSFLPELD